MREHHMNAPSPKAGEFRIMVVLGTLLAFASVSTDLYLPALPTLGVALRGQPGDIELTLSGFLVGFSLGQLLWGPLGDRYGRRVPILAGLVLFVIGSAGCATSSSVAQMVGWRVVQAVGACSGPVLARAMVRDLYARDRSAQMLSTLLLIMNVAPLLGPLVGAQILSVAPWQAIFWLLAVFGALTAAAVWTLPETLSPSRRVAAPLRRALADYLPLLRSRRLLGYAVSGGFFYAGIYAYVAGTPFAYIDYYRVPPQAYGLLFGFSVAGMMIANLVNRRLIPRFGSDRVFRASSAAVALAGLLCAASAWSDAGGLWGLVAPVFVYVAMAGFIVANSVAGAMSAFPERAGAASALVGAVHYGSGILSTALLGRFADGTPWTMGWIIGVSGSGCLLSALLLVRLAPSREA